MRRYVGEESRKEARRDVGEESRNKIERHKANAKWESVKGKEAAEVKKGESLDENGKSAREKRRICEGKGMSAGGKISGEEKSKIQKGKRGVK